MLPAADGLLANSEPASKLGLVPAVAPPLLSDSRAKLHLRIVRISCVQKSTTPLLAGVNPCTMSVFGVRLTSPSAAAHLSALSNHLTRTRCSRCRTLPRCGGGWRTWRSDLAGEGDGDGWAASRVSVVRHRCSSNPVGVRFSHLVSGVTPTTARAYCHRAVSTVSGRRPDDSAAWQALEGRGPVQARPLTREPHQLSGSASTEREAVMHEQRCNGTSGSASVGIGERWW